MISVVDKDSKGEIKVLPLHSTEVSADLHTGSNMAKGLVYANQHNSIQIAAKTSTTVLQSSQPAIYMHMPEEHRDSFRRQITLLRLKPTPETRIVVEFTANAFGRNRKRKVDEVEVEEVEVQGGEWLKITPTKPLSSGEYGLIILPQDTSLFGSEVYDFSIAGDPAPQKKQ